MSNTENQVERDLAEHGAQVALRSADASIIFGRMPRGDLDASSLPGPLSAASQQVGKRKGLDVVKATGTASKRQGGKPAIEIEP